MYDTDLLRDILLMLRHQQESLKRGDIPAAQKAGEAIIAAIEKRVDDGQA